MIGLENKSQLASAKDGHLVFVELRDVHAVDLNLPGSRPVQSGHEPEERALAASRWAHDGCELTVGDFESDVSNDLDGVRLVTDGLDQIADGNHDEKVVLNSMHRIIIGFMLIAFLAGVRKLQA